MKPNDDLLDAAVQRSLAECHMRREDLAFYRMQQKRRTNEMADEINIDDPEVAQIVPQAFSAAEAEWVESNFPALAGDQPDNFCTAFDSIDAIRFMQLEPDALHGLAKEFFCASAWHSARGRRELGHKYRERAENLRQILKEQIN